MATRRKAVSKKLRFEVFKRDRFACQYCGAKAPDVLLQVDHIVAVAAGGGNDILNLITSCEACNGGKGARALSDDAAVSKQRAQAAELQARREQIEMMASWQRGLLDIEDATVAIVAEHFQRLVPGWHLNESGLSSARFMLSKQPLDVVLSELRQVAAQCVRVHDGRATEESSAIVGRVWKRRVTYKAFRDQDPVGADHRYIRGILRNRLGLPNWLLGTALDAIESAHSLGVPVDRIKQNALAAESWEGFLALLHTDAKAIT